MKKAISHGLDEDRRVGARLRVELRNARFLTFAMLWGAAVGACGEEAKCGDCLEQGYRINFSPASEVREAPPAVLFSGWRNGWCQEDLLCTGTPDVLLGELNSGVLDYSCDKEELVAFSPGHAPNIALVNRSLTEMSVPLQPAVAVDVTLWIVSSLVPVRDAQFDADDARGIYADFGTGIDLVFHIKNFPDDRFAEVDGITEDGLVEGNSIYEWADCNFAARLSTMLDQGVEGYEPGFDADHLNVYYVAGINPSSGAAAGINCGYPPYFRHDVMFLDGQWESSPATLAHELGHAFGLRRGVTLPDETREQYGHVDELELDPYLPVDNLMESIVEKVGQVTVGQIYRMHYDELSWLWHGHEPGSEYPRACQSSPVWGGSCPPLTLHPSGGWP